MGPSEITPRTAFQNIVQHEPYPDEPALDMLSPEDRKSMVFWLETDLYQQYMQRLHDFWLAEDRLCALIDQLSREPGCPA